MTSYVKSYCRCKEFHCTYVLYLQNVCVCVCVCVIEGVCCPSVCIPQASARACEDRVSLCLIYVNGSSRRTEDKNLILVHYFLSWIACAS